MYPSEWYANKHTDMEGAELSDAKDSIRTIQGVSDKYIRIGVSHQYGPMPKSFPYTNGSSNNTTIKPFFLNRHTGIRGKSTSIAGLMDVVYLQNPKGGYATITLTPSADETKSENIFSQILSTFTFTDQKPGYGASCTSDADCGNTATCQLTPDGGAAPADGRIISQSKRCIGPQGQGLPL